MLGPCCLRGSSETDEFGEKFQELVATPELEEGELIVPNPSASIAKAPPPLPTTRQKEPLPREASLKEPFSEARTHRAQVESTKSDNRLQSLATVAVAVSVFFYEWATYNLIFLGRVLVVADKEAFIIPFFILFNSVWVLALWSYFKAHLSDPGAVPKRWQVFVHNVGDGLPIAPARLEWQPGKATFCKKCGVPRPERAHHCHVCQMCVLRMDHHCPYIFNCVGFNNHKYFLLLVIYTSMASLLSVGTTLPDLIWCFGLLARMEAGLDVEDTRLQTSELFCFLIFGLLALFLIVLLTPMVPTHMALAANNQTTIESNYSNMPNPFDLGSSAPNLAQIFGAFGADWFFPVKPRRPICDGVSFLRFDERLGPDGLPEMSDPAPGEDETEVERVWRLRYQVRSTVREIPDRADVGSGPLATLTQWWSRTPEAGLSPKSSPRISVGC